MGKDRNIVHQYFKKQMADFTLLVKVNPLHLKAMEITLYPARDPVMREIDVDENIVEDLKADGFAEASPIEFNLYLSGLIR